MLSNVFLKTGAYRPEVVAFTMKAASEAKIDMLIFDGADGGIGMSPVPMMNEMSTPTVHLQAQIMMCAKAMKKKGKFIPDLVMAGGFVNVTQIYKSMAMARAPLLTVMKSYNYVKLAEANSLPASFATCYGTNPRHFFINAQKIEDRFPGKLLGKDIPFGAVGEYTYFERVGEGLKQLMAGSRKFKLQYIERADIASLIPYAEKVTGIETLENMAERVMMPMMEKW